MMFLVMGAAIMMIGVILGHAISSSDKKQIESIRKN